jgi:hypothetical protein
MFPYFHSLHLDKSDLNGLAQLFFVMVYFPNTGS